MGNQVTRTLLQGPGVTEEANVALNFSVLVKSVNQLLSYIFFH